MLTKQVNKNPQLTQLNNKQKKPLNELTEAK